MRGAILTAPRARTLVVLAAVAAGALLVALVGAASANAAPKTIEIRGQGIKSLRFEGAQQIKSGKRLRIVNRTKASRVGPHTFTLVTKETMPWTQKQQRKCFDGPNRICFRTAVAHELDFETGEVGRPLVDVGRVGWDRPFTKERIGDSWITEARGEELIQPVSAKGGRTLRYFCAVHPFMRGKIGVN